MTSQLSSRRDFCKTAAGAALATAAGVLGAPGANDRLHFGVIGCGGMGTGHLSGLVKRSDKDNLRVLGVCDVYRRRVTRAEKISGAPGHLDYRRILDNKDIDAVLIATPDHWHGKIAVDALEAGKHVYVEKPMTHTIAQALTLRDTVRRTGKVLQVGPQATGEDG
jgi:predicted dehydrogenase